MKRKTGNISSFFVLIKLWLSLAVSLSAMAGYFIFAYKLTIDILTLGFGVYFFSAAASIFNQYQERGIDSKMERTRNRPLVLQEIKNVYAIKMALLFVFIGFCLLSLHDGWLPALLGFGNLVMYNCIYTILKRRSFLAIVVGALCGVIPVFIGWVAAGGYVLDKHILVFGMFMLLWQIPHFGLVLIKYGDEYKKAGFAAINNVLSNVAMRNAIFVWGLSCAIAGVLLGQYGLISHAFSRIVLIFSFLSFICLFSIALFGLKTRSVNYSLAFAGINSYMLMVFVMMVIDGL